MLGWSDDGSWGGVHHPDVELGTFFGNSSPDVAIVVFAGSR